MSNNGNARNPQNILNELAKSKGLRINCGFKWVIYDKENNPVYIADSFGEASQAVAQHGNDNESL